MNEAVLPCPLCGSQPEVRDFIATGSANYVQIECTHFHGDPDADECTSSVTVNADTMPIAIAAWNRRCTIGGEPPQPVLDALNKHFETVGVTTRIPSVLAYEVWHIVRSALHPSIGDSEAGAESSLRNVQRSGWKLVPVVEELVGRVEAATGPDREIDARLWCIATPNREFVAMATSKDRWGKFDPYAVGRDSRCADGMVFRRTDFTGAREDIQKHGGEFQQYPSSPEYTASIDAALALAERLFGIDTPSMLYNYDLGWHASAWAEMAFTADLHLAVGTPPEMQEFHGQSYTLPLAIIAATLKALRSLRIKGDHNDEA